jgi:hypothetical protein
VHDPAWQQPVVQPLHPDAPAVQPWLAQPSPVIVQSMQTRPPLPHAVGAVPATHAPFEQQPVAQLTESHPASPPELDPDPELDPEPDPEPSLEPELESVPASVAMSPPSFSAEGSPVPAVAQPHRASTPAATRKRARVITGWAG